MRLDASIPANNWKIIELYNKVKKGELDPSPDFQRKLVWKKSHKYKFIETILLNYPFPEIYIAPGELNVDSFEIKDIIVDGQQRTNAIVDYIEGVGVFGLNSIPIKKYSELTNVEKSDFLSYEVSIRYLKNASRDQVTDIFQRINNTEYSLNKTERLNAQWGESEFICFAKQMVEEDLDINIQNLNYTIEEQNRVKFINFFHLKYSIFSENDVARMLALQYVLTLLSTIAEEGYFRRNDKVQNYIEEYYEEFQNAGVIEENLINTLTFLENLDFRTKSYWLNKANIFTLIIELYNYDCNVINPTSFKTKLDELESYNLRYNELVKNSQDIDLPSDIVKYIEFAREGVNETSARTYRGEFIKRYISESIERNNAT